MRALSLAVLFLVLAGPADAAVVWVETYTVQGSHDSVDSFASVAVRGGDEVDRPVLEFRSDGTVRVSDPVGVTTGPGCAAIDGTSASCRSDLQMDTFSVNGGEGDDVLTWPTHEPLAHQPFGILRGGAGNDTVTAEGLQTEPFEVVEPQLVGDAGDDVLLGSDTDDELYGGPGRDVLRGGGGGDRLFGGGDGDSLVGGPDNDILNGDGHRPAAADLLDGGDGIDTLSYRGATTAATVNLALQGSGGAGRGDVLSGFEAAEGGSGDDVLRGDAGDNILDGGRGDDRVVGRGGDDTLRGGAGAPVLFGGGGDDQLDASGQGARLYGGAGDDVLAPSGYSERPAPGVRVRCGSGDDEIRYPPRGTFVGDCEMWSVGDYDILLNKIPAVAGSFEPLGSGAPCRVGLALVDVRDGQTLAAGQLDHLGHHRRDHTTLRLTAAGRTFVRRTGRHRVQLRVSDGYRCRGRLSAVGAVTVLL